MLSSNLNAQLGFCTGNSGDPIFTETFGTGTTSNQLPVGTTSYQFVSQAPNDGFYTVANSTNGWYGWHNIGDRTPNDTNGKMLIINADFTAGEFYRTRIDNLCESTTYEFSAWMVNILPPSGCGGNGISINVQFEIWDSDSEVMLAAGSTGSLYGTSSPNWQQYALVFQTEPMQSSVILKMRNNGVGGCGNDLAIDDIVFKSCGDNITVEDAVAANSTTICESDTPFSTTLIAEPDFTIFSSHFYQWQISSDGENWTDVIGETSNILSTQPILSTTYFRVKVAEDLINVNNASCNTISEVYKINVIPTPDSPLSNGDLRICQNDTTPLAVSVPSGIMVNWYDAPNNGNLIESNSTTFSPFGISGVYYAEAVSEERNCSSSTRTRLQVQYDAVPEVNNEELEFCEGTSITLSANPNITTSTYLWNTGETTESIDVIEQGIYTVDVSNESCTVTKTIQLSQVDNPIIGNIVSNGKNIVVSTLNNGDFEYSLNGTNFQFNNTFTNLEGGLYTIYVKDRNCNDIVSREFLHFYIPKFFTPNNDGVNDTFNLNGLEFYATSSVSIFNRYGKLLKSTTNASFSWDGTYTGQQLPTDDYWYVITIEGKKFMGHFTLKR